MEFQNFNAVEPIINNEIDEQFFAPVRKISAKELMPDFNFNRYNDTMIEIETKKGPIICNNCSSEYLLVPNREIFPVLEQEMQKFGLSDIRRSIVDNSSFFVDYDFVDKKNKIKIAKGDVIFPRISIENSYNSRYMFKINAGFMRQVCTNGLCIPVEDSTFETILSHSKGNIGKIVAESLEGISTFFGKAKEIAGEYEILMETKVSDSDIEDCVENILRKSKALISYKEDIIERIRRENEENKIEINLFSIYNGINYYLQPIHNETLTADSVKRRQMDEKILDVVFSMAS